MPHLQGIPKVFWWSTVPTILFARTIAHEMAHHIYLCRNELCYVTNSSDVIEGVANNYARDVLNQMRKERKYRLGFWWVKEIAFWHYSLGILDFRENKYASSADHFFYAWKLDPRLDGVASRYWAAIDKLSSS